MLSVPNHIEQLLNMFVAKFMELFFPKAFKPFDFNHLESLSQEVCAELVAGDKLVVDVLVKTRLAGGTEPALVLVEPQAYTQEWLGARLRL
ncbi:MAG: hypothetical protein PHV61_10475 [Limnochordia bacterium]|nr:hypothetical protein [Limnochordia bacterium]MDD2630567.1 hypothetical protein [Limnochordia bacterium]MDD4518846.1 hypothetical protein [Limnochordia bacterium]